MTPAHTVLVLVIRLIGESFVVRWLSVQRLPLFVSLDEDQTHDLTCQHAIDHTNRNPDEFSSIGWCFVGNEDERRRDVSGTMPQKYHRADGGLFRMTCGIAPGLNQAQRQDTGEARY
jgi:hypothetical protein